MLFAKSTHADAQRALYQKLEKRYGLAMRSPALKKSRQSWHLKGKQATHSAFTRAFSASQSILFGDHRLRLDHSRQLVDWLTVKGTPHANTVWVTNRFDATEQQHLQAWLDDRLSFQELLTKLDHPPQSLTHAPRIELWPWLMWVKKHGVNVQWLTPKGSLAKQAQSFYKTCFALHAQGKAVLGWTGYLTLAPCWSSPLPPGMMRVALEQPALHWKHAAGSKRKPWFQRDQTWVRLDSLPMLSLECSRLFQEEQTWFLSPDACHDAIKTCWENYADMFKVPAPKNPIRIWHPFGSSFALPTPIARQPSVQRFVERRMARGENVVLPNLKWIILMQLSPALVAEEAMHAFRLFPMAQQTYGPWVSVWEEAWGMFGSLCVDPNRPLPDQQPTDLWSQVHMRGYHLGAALFDLYHDGPKQKKKIRMLFAKATVDESQAQKWVLDTEAWVEKVL